MNEQHPNNQATIIAISSGKGGVGKTSIATNLAIALAQSKARTCIFDADTNLANINILLNLNPQYTIQHVIDGEKSIHDILLEGPDGIKIVPAASGIAAIADLTASQQEHLIRGIEQIENKFDYIILDTAAGTGSDVVNFIRSSHELILIITTEPTSLTDAFALLRVLKQKKIQVAPFILVNMALNYADSMEVYKRFDGAVKKYLNMTSRYLGYIIKDSHLPDSVKRQQAIITTHPHALSSRCFRTLAQVIRKQFPTYHRKVFSDLWNTIRADSGIEKTEFSSQAGRFRITDNDVRHHISEEAPLKRIHELLSPESASLEQMNKALDAVIAAIINKLQSPAENGYVTSSERSALGEHIRKSLEQLAALNQAPDTIKEGRSLLRTIRRIHSNLQHEEALLDTLIEEMEYKIREINEKRTIADHDKRTSLR